MDDDDRTRRIGDDKDKLPSFCSEPRIEVTQVMPNAPYAPARRRTPVVAEATSVMSFPPETEREPMVVAGSSPSAAIETAPPVPVGMVKSRALFREQAVQSYLASMRDNEVLRVAPPWARGIMRVAAVTLLAVVVASFLVEVDQTSRGRGILRVAGGVQALACQTNGVVQELTTRSGDIVAPDAVVAKIDSTATKMALLEADRQIQRAEEDVAGFVARRDKEQAKRIALLRQSAGLLAQRAQNQRTSVARLKQRSATFDKLASEGLASELDRSAAENDLAAGERSTLELEEQISATQLQISNIAADLAQELDRQKAEVKKATDRREALTLQLQQTEVRAPRGGRIEALVVKVGDPVTVGMTIARLIPQGAPREIVVFLPEADRAFLQVGSEVQIELDQLPAGEFGGLHSKVVRISADLATPAEVAEVLDGTKLEGPSYRIELTLEDGDTVRRLDKLLRPGSLVTARFVLRKRRLATLLFEPLRRLFH